MRLMKTITLTMVLVLACTSSALLAQENSADILVKLDVIAPIKSPVRGIRSPIRQQVDWEKAADEIGDLLARAKTSCWCGRCALESQDRARGRS